MSPAVSSILSYSCLANATNAFSHRPSSLALRPLVVSILPVYSRFPRLRFGALRSIRANGSLVVATPSRPAITFVDNLPKELRIYRIIPYCLFKDRDHQRPESQCSSMMLLWHRLSRPTRVAAPSSALPPRGFIPIQDISPSEHTNLLWKI
jgi:hypothetical protein